MENNELKAIGIWQKIWSIQKESKSLIKDEKNKFQNYNYFEESQVLGILKPLLEKYRLGLMVCDDDSQPFQHEREGTNHYIKYLKKIELIDLDNKETQPLVYKFWACGSNTDLAKAKGSSETYAMKYILSKFFLIKVVDENDPDQKKDGKTTINPAETEKKRVMEKIILKEDGWFYCKRCEEATEQKPFKLVEKRPDLKLNELKEALKNHGELERK